MRWYQQWDGTVQSLNRKSKDGGPLNYKTVQSHIEDSLGQKVPLSDIQRYGKECDIKWRKVQELTLPDIDDEYWNQIAKFRKFLQRIHNDRLMFIDETAIYAVMPPRQTIVAPGYQPLIIVEKPSAHAQRYDFIGALNGSQSIACMILTPADRKNRNIEGIRKEVVNEWIVKTLAPAINRLGSNNIYLICNKSRSHRKVNMMEALKAGKCKSVVDICYMPIALTKYISPLDNSICHGFKEAIRSQYPVTAANLPSLLSKTFLSLSRRQIKNAYRKCAIVRGTDVYYDRPST
ncbi:unnamed protein product [Rotaria sordida]|uniref:DDE-1 domain-containing protein n=3 Tax=Rotaria sordida TaxID=392033 RepID=A0A819CRZ3_9BILA|nr:unnamed protein product [Rotaria sordida]CAF1522779.1 unnamed protein product [Rotaria sordida]CAF3812307.1 unnamed protein product [Rotaria sordida]